MARYRKRNKYIAIVRPSNTRSANNSSGNRVGDIFAVIENSTAVRILRIVANLSIVITCITFSLSLIDRDRTLKSSLWEAALSEGKSGAIRAEALSSLAKWKEPVSHINLGDPRSDLTCDYYNNNYISLPTKLTTLDNPIGEIPYNIKNAGYFIGLDLSRNEFEEVNFSDLFLQSPNFENSNQVRNSYKSAIILFPNFEGAHLYDVCFAGASIQVGNFDHAAIDSSTFYFTDISSSSFSHAVINSSRVMAKQIEGTRFDNSCVIASELFGILNANFEGAFIDHSTFRIYEPQPGHHSFVIFKSAYISYGIFKGQRYHFTPYTVGEKPPPETYATGDPNHLDFSNARIAYSNFIGSTLFNTNFSNARLMNVDFSEIKFKNVNISGTNFDSDVIEDSCVQRFQRFEWYNDAIRATAKTLTNEQLIGAWAWDDQLPTGLRNGVRPGHICPKVLRSNYNPSEIGDIPGGC